MIDPVDIAADGTVRPTKPCCKRITHPAFGLHNTYGFCGLLDGHDGGCLPIAMSTAPTPSNFDKGKRK